MKQRFDRTDAIPGDADLRQYYVGAAAVRQLLSLLVVLTPLFVLVMSVQAMDSPTARALYQSSPLSPLATSSTSPLAAPLAVVDSPLTAVESSSVSIYLVGMVLMSMLVVVAMVVWRRQ